MKIATNNLTTKEIQAYRAFLEAGRSCGHLMVDDIEGYSVAQAKGYLSSLDKKGYIQFDCDYAGMFYAIAKFDDGSEELSFYGENLKDDQYEALEKFLGA
jgi:hypothetical protein